MQFETPQQETNPLDVFRQTIERLRAHNGNLASVDVRELTEDDMRTLERAEQGEMTKEELAAYKVSITDNESRRMFAEYVANRFTAIYTKKKLEEMKKQKAA